MEDFKLVAQLYEKINKVTYELGVFNADKRNKFDGYNYISYENVNSKLRSLLKNNNLSISSEITGIDEAVHITIAGAEAVRSIVHMKFKLVDTVTGYSETKSWIGSDIDQKGKSIGQAITESQKRFELKLFHASTVSDVDPDSHSMELKGKEDNIKSEYIKSTAKFETKCYACKKIIKIGQENYWKKNTKENYCLSCHNGKKDPNNEFKLLKVSLAEQIENVKLISYKKNLQDRFLMFEDVEDYRILNEELQVCKKV